MVFSGMHGVGKTTTLLSLACIVAGVHKHAHPLAPKFPRHVIYITEDIMQAFGIVHAITRSLDSAAAMDLIKERVHFVEAKRMPIEEVVQVGQAYIDRFSHSTLEGVVLDPLVVIDTRSATIQVSDENDNAEAARIMAALKQSFMGLPTWLVGHVAKTTSRSEVQQMSSRGASAIEADAHQTAFLTVEDTGRYIALGKTRFEPKYREIEILSHVDELFGVDEFGDSVTVPIRYAELNPLEPGEKAQREAEVKEEEKENMKKDKKRMIFNAVARAREKGEPATRTEIANESCCFRS
jgi:RecA-family ATPase